MQPDTTYTVKPGDTLSKIATNYGVNITDITGYASGDPNKIGVGETLKVGARTTTPANVVPATGLGQTPYKTPEPVVPTGYAGLIASTNTAITDVTPDVTKGQQDIKDKYTKLGTLPTARVEGYADEGVNTKQAEYRRQVNTINQKELGFQTRIDKIRNSNPTGQLTDGQQIQIDQLSKDWAVEKAGLTIAAAFAKDDYELAKSVVDTRIDAEVEGLKNELMGLQFFYEENKDTLSESKKNLLSFQIAQIQDEKAKTERLYTDIGNIQLAAAKNGAPASVVAAIGKTGDLTQAISAAGSWIDETIDRTGGGGLGGGSVDLAPEDERTLIGAGFTLLEIKDLRNSIATKGIEATLAGITDPKKKAAVQATFNQDVPTTFTRADIDSDVTLKVAADKIKNTLTKTQIINTLKEKVGESALFTAAKKAGYASMWTSKTKDINRFLESDAGYNFLLESEAARQYVVDMYVEKARAAGSLTE